MTLRQSMEFALIECNKLKAPSILLEDYIYLFNKAIQQYINSAYNRAEFNQQSSDDLGFLQTVTTVDTKGIEPEKEFNDTIWKGIQLPYDYLHMLNCIAEFTGTDKKAVRCGNSGIKTITSPCHRLTADLYPGILNNYYMQPSHKKPYYYIINHNTETKDGHTNPEMEKEIETVGLCGYNPVLQTSSNRSDYGIYTLKENGSRISHQSPVNIEIHSGNSDWKLDKLYITYLKAPKYVSMTQEQVLATEDTSDILEFPDYICYEIINIYIRLLLENASDPRLQSHIPINQSIAIPGSN